MAKSKKKQTAGKYSTGQTNRRGIITVICVAATILLIALLIGLWFLLDVPTKLGRVPDGVTAAGVDISGMRQDEAETALRAATQSTYSQKDMVVQILDETYALTSADTGAAFDASAASKAAVGLTSSGVMDILPYLSLDQTALQNFVSALDRQYNAEFAQSAYRIEDAQTEDGGQTLILSTGAPGYTLDGDALYALILSAYNDNRFLVEADCAAELPEPLDLDAIYQEIYIEPVDAVMDMETFEVTPETNGLGFDLAAAKEALANAEYGVDLEIPLEPIIPEVTAESLESLLFRDVLATYSTPHTSDSNRNTNLRLASEACNGVVIQPGEVFSFNDTLGKRTAEKGYKPAGAYANGQVVTTTGGGICQVSSTIYYCALMADLEIVERTCHMFTTSYMPYGMDATVSWGTLDFRFRNNTDYPIRIEAEVADGYVTVSLIGTDTKDYYVEMEYEIKATYSPNTVYKEMVAGNADGYKDGDVITTATTGYSVNTYRCKYDKETGELISREFEDSSKYDKRDKVICKIIPDPTPEDVPSEIITGGGVTEDPGD